MTAAGGARSGGQGRRRTRSKRPPRTRRCTKLRAQKAAQDARACSRLRQSRAARVTKQARARRVSPGRGELTDLTNLTNSRATRWSSPAKANRRQAGAGEAAAAKGEKSWIIVRQSPRSRWARSAGCTRARWREAIPASAAWVVLLTIASKILPTLLLWPVLMVVMPLSGIAGVVYALQYNRHGGRQRLFGDDKKQLAAGKDGREE